MDGPFEALCQTGSSPTPNPSPLDLCGVWAGGEALSAWPRCTSTTLCLVDGQVTGPLLRMLTALGIEDVISTERPRRSIPGWRTIVSMVPHASVGGVSLAVQFVHHHTLCEVDGLPIALEEKIPRSAATVLSHSTFAQHFRQKPSRTLLSSKESLNLGTETNPIFHGHGWLPPKFDQTTRVLIPVLISSSHGGKWGL